MVIYKNIIRIKLLYENNWNSIKICISTEIFFYNIFLKIYIYIIIKNNSFTKFYLNYFYII